MAVSPTLHPKSDRARRLAILLLILVGAILPALSLRAVWLKGPGQVSAATNKLPEWDFANLWAGGTLALQDKTDVLFDIPAYRAWFQEHVGAERDSREWSYPPSMLVVSAPLAELPLFPSYLLWTIGSLALLYLVLVWGGVSHTAAIVATLSPAALNNIIFGQTGALTAALLLGALLFAGRRQIGSGVFAGLLTVKPQLGLLIPICLLAARNWRAIATAIIVALTLAVTTSALFGWDVYPLFFERTAPMMRSIMEAGFPQSYQTNAITIFVSVRALGASVGLAYAVQAVAFALCCLACWHLWRLPSDDPPMRVAATCCLALLATPYSYTYDMVPLGFAATMLFLRNGWKFRPVLFLCWLWPSLAVFVNTNLFPVTPLVVGLMAWLAWQSLRTKAAPEVRP